MSDWRGAAGGPVRWRSEIGRYFENDFLFKLEEYLFCKDFHKYLRGNLYGAYSRLEDKNFPNHYHGSVKEKKLSHDQITSSSSYSFRFLKVDIDLAHEAYWQETKLMRLRGRFVPPKTYIYLALLNKSWIGFALLPLLYVLCAWTFFIGSKKDFDGKEDLSGELLYLVMVKSTEHDSTLEKVLSPCMWIARKAADKKYGGLNQMVRDYFKNQKGHPIVENVDLEGE